MADHFYVYPAYLSASASRSSGRRVPKELAAREVTLEELVDAAKSLGHSAVAEPERHYPRAAHLYGGRVKVNKRKGVSKAAFLKALAERLHRRPPSEERS